MSYALWWSLLPQIAAFPLAWHLLHHIDSRYVMFAGLLSCGIGIALAAFATNQTSAEQLHLSLVLLGVGQMLFLVPALLVGASSLKPEDGPTATIAFNATTVGGTTLGVGLISHFVTEREKFHSSVLVEHVSWLDPNADRSIVLVDGRPRGRALATTKRLAIRAIAQIASTVRREAWLLVHQRRVLVDRGRALSLDILRRADRSKPSPRSSSITERCIMKLRTVTIVGLLVAASATAAVGAIVLPGSIVQAWDRHYTDNAYVRGDITQISPEGLRLRRRRAVKDNQPVKAGDLLFQIDDRDFRARLLQAKAALAARRRASAIWSAN